MLKNSVNFFLENRLITLLLVALMLLWGIATSPFNWNTGIPIDSVPVDAIPDIGENQQIIFTEWAGRSPQDVEDQITYPLTTALLGISGVKTIRSTSMFGFSSIYIIFKEDVEFYWSRSRILEKLNSLPVNLLPEGVNPALGPDATALGQVFWYTLEGRDENGNVTGGWDLHELRTIQDFYVKYALSATDGVSEVASIGGFVQEYQVDVNPEALRIYNVSLEQVISAVRNSNRDVGAKTLEINRAEYLVRGLGYIKSIEDIEKAVVASNDNVPIRISEVAHVSLGPANRRGILDKEGAEVVGGVAVARYGSNPLSVINNLKDKIEEISVGLPKKTLESGKVSQLTIVPFYDRTQLINETLGTLQEALSLEILVTMLVVIILVANIRASVIISGLLPFAVLLVFIAMKYVGIDANIVALSGIAIAIGTMVDLGIIVTENILKKINAPGKETLFQRVKEGTMEVSTAVITAVSTTVISFIPVFTLEAAEGKLFKPLAFTKTFALIASLLVALFVLPALSYLLFRLRVGKDIWRKSLNILILLVGIIFLFYGFTWAGITILGTGIIGLSQINFGDKVPQLKSLMIFFAALSIAWLLGEYWLPLGASRSNFSNFLMVVLLVGSILLTFYLVERYYKAILGWCLDNKKLFLSLPTFLIILGITIWFGFARIFDFIPKGIDLAGYDLRTSAGWKTLSNTFPGIGSEFMPSLDEGSFLLMPTSMPHSGIEENRKIVQQLDILSAAIPEVETVVGKMGRVESALDPAPISMFENVINYKPEYILDENGYRIRFKSDTEGKFILDDGSSLSREEIINRKVSVDRLIPDSKGKYFRNWRDEIKSPQDIWNEIVKMTKIPGVTSAPKLQPIETRLVMLQTGMRAPMGIKIFGPDLQTIEDFGLQVEKLIKEVPSVKSQSVFADRIVGKPYLHLNIDRDAISRYGLSVEALQKTIESAIGGMAITTTVEGRERFVVRVRYPRELRDDPESIGNILIATPTKAQIPLKQLVSFEYVRGPQMIKSEDTFLVGYVLFDKNDGYAEVETVEQTKAFIELAIENGDLKVPNGISYKFSGSYENQVRAANRLSVIIPIVLALIFLILYLQFKSVTTSLMIFSGVALAISGGFLMLWLYGQDWFINFSLFGTNLRELFHMKPINLSVAVWVGFIALFGIATDDGVLIGTYLKQSFEKLKPSNRVEVRNAVLDAGLKRVRPALMTIATTLIALMPVLSSTGRGADIMIPMAIPSFGGMAIALLSIFVVPVLYCFREEIKVKNQ